MKDSIPTDIESLLEKSHTCDNNPEKSSTIKTNECTIQHVTIADLRKHVTAIITYERKEMLPLTDEEIESCNWMKTFATPAKKAFIMLMKVMIAMMIVIMIMMMITMMMRNLMPKMFMVMPHILMMLMMITLIKMIMIMIMKNLMSESLILILQKLMKLMMISILMNIVMMTNLMPDIFIVILQNLMILMIMMMMMMMMMMMSSMVGYSMVSTKIMKKSLPLSLYSRILWGFTRYLQFKLQFKIRWLSTMSQIITTNL